MFLKVIQHYLCSPRKQFNFILYLRLLVCKRKPLLGVSTSTKCHFYRVWGHGVYEPCNHTISLCHPSSLTRLPCQVTRGQEGKMWGSAWAGAELTIPKHLSEHIRLAATDLSFSGRSSFSNESVFLPEKPKCALH